MIITIQNIEIKFYKCICNLPLARADCTSACLDDIQMMSCRNPLLADEM